MLSRGKITVSEVFDRIKAVKGVKTDKSVAELLGLRPGTLAEQKARDTIPYREIIAFCDREGLSLDDVFLGQPTDRVAEGTAQYGLTRERDEFVFVPEYNVTASAGHGAEIPPEEVVRVLAVRQDWVRREVGANPQDLVVVAVRGESMEPAIRAGDLIMVDRAETTPASEGLYVIRVGGALMVKRVQPLPGGALELISDHPAYKPVTLRREDLGADSAVVGRVVWVGRKV